MGRSLSADLHYGYLLGSDDDGWDLEGIDEDNYATYPEIDGFDEDDEEDFQEFLEGRLKAAPVEGVEFDYVGYHAGYTVLVFKTPPDSVYGVEVIDLPQGPPQGADEALAMALEVLGIKPTQEKPSWILAATYF
jgi:hypothetical protein